MYTTRRRLPPVRTEIIVVLNENVPEQRGGERTRRAPRSRVLRLPRNIIITTNNATVRYYYYYYYYYYVSYVLRDVGKEWGGRGGGNVSTFHQYFTADHGNLRINYRSLSTYNRRRGDRSLIRLGGGGERTA